MITLKYKNTKEGIIKIRHEITQANFLKLNQDFFNRESQKKEGVKNPLSYSQKTKIKTQEKKQGQGL